MDIAVVGCGVAGQAAAIFLADAGHRVTVFERFVEPRPVGAGLLLQPTGLAVLRALGLADEAIESGATVRGLQGRTASGRIVLDLAYADLHKSAHGLGIRRSVLFDLLHGRLKRSTARLVTGCEIADVEGGHLVEKAGRRHGPFDLVIVADGAHSALRPRQMPEARAPLYPWGCLWTTVLDVAGVQASGLLQQRVRGTVEMMGLLPVGNGQLTLYWSVPAGATPDLEGFRRGALALWPETAEAVEQAVRADAFTHATYRHVALPRWNAGTTLFIGDAAHGTSPQLGQGANLGLMDAWVLGRSLSKTADIPSAFADFAQQRSATVRFYRQASHLLTPFFQSRFAPLGWARDAFLGLGCRLPVLRPLMTTTLGGLRRGWLSTRSLGAEGNYRLEA